MRLERSLAAAVLAIGLTLALAPGQLEAQNIAQVWTVKPAAGASTGFESAFRDHMEWRKANGETWNWITYEVVTGPNRGDYIVRSGDHTWADFDEYEAGFGPKGGFSFGATVMPLVASATMTITATDATKLRLPDDMAEYNLFRVITWNLKPGRERAFNKAVDQYHEAITEADAPTYYAFVNPVAGAAGPSVTGVFFEKNWAGFAGDDPTMEEMMIEKYGEDGFAEIVEQISSSMVSSESQVIRVRWDLSIVLDDGM
ncbi:MAG: hypothetical protein BMS9Abin29_0854 [Gemmatimonadota bacterium]|nr:MAG: hypothetical protein BMS9Abin29_0854 [Gemmatimonadota bacterium]